MICSYWSMIKFLLHINTELIFVLGSAVVSVTKKMILFKWFIVSLRCPNTQSFLTIYRLHSRGFQSLILKCLKCLFKDDIVSPNTCTCTFIVRMCMDSRVDVLIIVLVIANCPIGYTQHGNSCYVINRVQASWAQASVSTFRPTSSPLCRV